MIAYACLRVSIAASTTLFSLSGAPPSGSLRSSGVLGGLQIGYNWQFNRNWLIGLETDFDWSGMKGSGSTGGVIATMGGSTPFTATADEHINGFGTIRARLGYLPTDNLLAYLTGGFAYGKVEHTGAYIVNGITSIAVTNITSFACAGSGATCFSGSSSRMATGWTVGGGLEYAFWQKWSLKAEYLFVSLDSKSLTETALVLPGPGTLPASFSANFNRTNFNVARVGLNYRF
jgi:outer membrane immunogenic protein